MQVFIMRHGDAALDAASDSVRPLTSCGCDESRLMANWLKGQKVDIERVLVSPFLRAEQTLDVVGECMNLPTGVDVLPELTPCGDVGLVSAYLQALANEGIATAHFFQFEMAHVGTQVSYRAVRIQQRLKLVREIVAGISLLL